MKNLHLMITSILLTAVSSYSATHTLTFKQTTNIALEKSSKVHQYQERLKSKSYDSWSAKSSFFPTITLQGSYNRIKEPLTFDLSPVRNAIIELETRSKVDNLSLQSQLKGGPAITQQSPSYSTYYNTARAAFESAIPQFIDTLKEQQYPSASLLAIQPLFTGGRIYAMSKIAKADLTAANCDLDRIKNETTKETITLCINFILAENLVKIRNSVLTDMMHHMNKASLLSEQGMIARYHLLRAKVAVAEAQRNLEGEQNRLDIVNFAIKKYCNIAEQDTITISDSLSYMRITDSVDTYENLAEKNNPLLMILQQNKTMARCKLTAAKGVMAPQISAFGKYELFQDYLSALEPEWIAGIQMNLPLFTGGKNIAAVGSATHLVSEVNNMELSAQRDINLLINKTYKDMRSAESRYLHLDADLDLATENLHQCKSRFESGYGTSLEVIDAELVLERNRIDRLVALGDYCKALTELYTTTGFPSKVLPIITGVIEQ